VAAGERKREALAVETAQQQKNNRNLQARLREAFPLAAPAATAGPASPAQPVAGKDGAPLTGLAKMFREQAVREAIRSEMKFGVARNVAALLNSGLAQQLQLNDDQTATLREFLTQKTSILMDRMLLPMVAGEIQDADMAATGRAIKQAIDEKDAQIRGLLGADGYNLYQWYEKTQPDRDKVTQFGSQLSSAGQTLSADQQAQLFSIMTGERANFKFQYEPGELSRIDFEHWYDNFTPEKIDTYAGEMERLNEIIVQRAQSVISGEQAAQLKDFLAQRLLHARITAQTTTFGKR
jgi:hypothetical protein